MALSIIKWYKEATIGVIPSPVVNAYNLKAEGFDIKSTQDEEQNQLFGNGRGSSEPTYGVDSFGGSFPTIFGVDNALIFLSHGIGDATATADATASLWTVATATTVGDKVNHSDGLHTLVCKSILGTGTTDGITEPDLSAYTTAEAGRGLTIVDNAGDNQVTWYIMPKLFTHSGVRGDCLSSFGIQVTDDGGCVGGADAFHRYTGLYINSFSLSLNGDTKGIKVSFDCVGYAKQDSIADADWTALTITNDITLKDDFYSFDQCLFELNGVSADKFISLDISVANNVTMTNGMNSQKIDDLGGVAVTGSVSALFSTALYTSAINHDIQTLTVTLSKATGGSMIITLPQFQMKKTDPMFEYGKKTKFETDYTAFDTDTSTSIEWTCTTPIATY